MALHAQKKGKRGEVEFCKWLLENLNISVERNYNQADGHSADVVTDDFLFEVKRREALDLDNWWYQVVIAGKRKPDLIPVVPFRKNREKWQFLVPAKLINGLDKGYLIMSEKVFIEYAKTIIKDLENEELVQCSGVCGDSGVPNYIGDRFYCGGSERCIP